MAHQSHELTLRKMILPAGIEFFETCGQICFPLYLAYGMSCSGGAVYLIHKGLGAGPDGELLPSNGECKHYAGQWLSYCVVIPYDATPEFVRVLIDSAIKSIGLHLRKPRVKDYIRTIPRTISRKVRAFLAA